MTLPVNVETIHTATVGGRRYMVWRVGADPNGWQWHAFGVTGLYTDDEARTQAWKLPRIPHFTAYPVSPVGRWLGAHECFGTDPTVTDGWVIRDELNRATLGHATDYDDMIKIAAQHTTV
ncbi:hypothetical protein AB0395_22265 [Streptosporangium sp. NPDC051023]|uniref:hypothetical protein n=1 Tax=Streptosporangium sp. NPDC051023 TaxID=3155410 RepID=UPI00344EE47E